MRAFPLKNSLAVGALLLVLAGCAHPPAGNASSFANSRASAPAPVPARDFVELDADRDGLYDDAERKAFLDLLAQHVPDLGGPFDADGDGRVTIAEMEQGRHPLTLRIPRDFPAKNVHIPWTIDLFPEWLSTAYLQDDVAATGEIAEHASRGLIKRPAAQADAALRPRKLRDGGGVEFAANSGQHLSMEGHRDAFLNYRWCILTFRIDGRSGTNTETVLVDINRGDTSNKSTPKIWFSKKTGLNIQYVGRNAGGLDRRVMSTKHIVADGRTWNVLVCGVRFGQMFASVNGVPLRTREPQPPRFAGEWPFEATSFIGDARPGNSAWAYDSLIFGLTEPSEAMVRKMTGWAAHRLDIARRLPADHPYATQRPIVDAEDLPARYVHDEERWAAWRAALKDESRKANAGGPRVEPRVFERVFHDDFRAYRIGQSTSGEGDLWVGYGFNAAVGGQAPLIEPGAWPDAYTHDAAKGLQTLSLVTTHSSTAVRGSAIYTVNDSGHGYTWAGPKVFRIRCMFPKIEPADLAPGLFPAFWSYGIEWLFWRTSNRIENDWFEFDGKNGHHLNAIWTHVHYSHMRDNVFAKQATRYPSDQFYGGELTEAASGIPGGLYIWDGQFHTWEWVIDEETTTINVTIPDGAGGERWVEITRGPTSPTYLERQLLILDYALKTRVRHPTKRQDFVVDFVEVLQKTSDLEKVPAPFTARPRLALKGKLAAGATITCEAKVDGVTDLRYFWFADGYPLTYGPSPTYTLTAADVGKQIRCMVKAVGALDSPEAWSVPLRHP